MSQSKAEPLQVRSSSLVAPFSGRPSLEATRYSLYSISSTSESTSEPRSSIYDASVCASLDDEPENKPDVGPSAQSAPRPWPQRKTKTTSIEPPDRPRAPTSQPSILEVRFSNRPQGTPLTTIMEQRSSLSLRHKLSEISSKRSFTPIHVDPKSNYLHTTDAPAAAARRQVSLSLDEAAIREFRKIFEGDSTDSGPGQPVFPPHPPHERTSTPPKTPRWPGDLTPEDIAALERASSRGRLRQSRLVRAMRSLLFTTEPGAVPCLISQDHRTVRVPQRIGAAYWRPARSGHFTSGYEDASRHPFHDAPLLAPTTEVPCRTVNDENAPPATEQSTFRLVSDAEHPSAAAQSLNAVEPSDTPQFDERHLLPIVEEHEGRECFISHANKARVPFSRNDVQNPYTADSAPVDHLDALSLRSADSNHTTSPANALDLQDSAHEETATAASVVTVNNVEENRVHMYGQARRGESMVETRRSSRPGSATIRSTGSMESNQVLLQADGSSATPGIAASPDHEDRRVTHFTSAALPILLPIAAREGIVRPIHLQARQENRSSSNPRRQRPSQASRNGGPNAARAQFPSMALPIEAEPPATRARLRHMLHRCPHVSPEALATRGRELTIGRISVSVRQGDRCLKCKMEKAIRWMLESCFCQIVDGSSDSEGARMVQLEQR